MKKDVSDFKIGDYITGRSVSDPKKYFTVLNRRNEYSDIYGEGIGNMCGAIEYYPNSDYEPFTINSDIKIDYATPDEIRHLDQCIAAKKYVAFKKPIDILLKNEIYHVHFNHVHFISGGDYLVSPIKTTKIAKDAVNVEYLHYGCFIDEFDAGPFHFGDDPNDCTVTPATNEQKKDFYKAKFTLKTDEYYKYLHVIPGSTTKTYFQVLDSELDFSDRIGIKVMARTQDGTEGMICFHFYNGDRTLFTVSKEEYMNMSSIPEKTKCVSVLSPGIVYKIIQNGSEFLVKFNDVSNKLGRTNSYYISKHGAAANFYRTEDEVISVATTEERIDFIKDMDVLSEETIKRFGPESSTISLISNNTLYGITLGVSNKMLTTTSSGTYWVPPSHSLTSDDSSTIKKQSKRKFKVFTNKNKQLCQQQ